MISIRLGVWLQREDRPPFDCACIPKHALAALGRVLNLPEVLSCQLEVLIVEVVFVFGGPHH